MSCMVKESSALLIELKLMFVAMSSEGIAEGVVCLMSMVMFPRLEIFGLKA